MGTRHPLSARKTRLAVVHQQESNVAIAKMIGEQARQIAVLAKVLGGRSFFGRMKWLLLGK